MIIQCDKCQTKFRLDDSKVKGAGVKVRCTKCQNVFVVTPPIEEVVAEEVTAQPSEGRKKSEEGGREKAAARENLSFEFSEGAKGPVPEKEMEKEEEGRAPSAGIGADTEERGLDFSFKSLGADEGPPEGAIGGADGGADDERLGGPPDRGDRTLGGFDIGLGAPEKEAPTVEEGPDISPGGYSGWGEEAGEGREEAPPTGSTEEERAGGVTTAAGYGGAGGLAEPSLNEEVSTGDFSEALKESVERGGEMPPHTEEVYYDEAAGGATRARGSAWVVIAVAAIVVVIGLGVLYFRGQGGGLTGGVMSRDAATAAKKTVDIEGIKGYFVENRAAGKVFVIEARIRNLSETPQEIKSVRGVLYNAGGVKLAERSVAPGRVLSADDLKTLPREELLRHFKDPSAGSIPPKGTIPVMVLFTEAPAGLTEYGVDVVR